MIEPEGPALIEALGGLNAVHELPDGSWKRLGDMTREDVQGMLQVHKARFDEEQESLIEYEVSVASDELATGEFRYSPTGAEQANALRVAESAFTRAQSRTSLEVARSVAQRAYDERCELLTDRAFMKAVIARNDRLLLVVTSELLRRDIRSQTASAGARLRRIEADLAIGAIDG